MATAGSIVVDLLMRTGSFQTDTERASKAFQKTMRDMSQEVSKLEKSVGVGLASVAAIGGAGLSLAFSKFITETRNSQDEQAQLTAALRSTGEAAGFSADKLNEMASAFAGSSTFSEGDINKAQTRLLAYTGVVGDQFPRALQAAMDMSTRLGTSFEQAAETVGKALDVPSKGLDALSKQGFRFSDDQKKLVQSLEATGKTAEAQAIVLQAMESAYGGAAQAARNTLGGALDALGHQIDSLMTGSNGSVMGLTAQVNDLTNILGSNETRQNFGTFTTWLADIATGSIEAVNRLGAYARVTYEASAATKDFNDKAHDLSNFGGLGQWFDDLGMQIATTQDEFSGLKLIMDGVMTSGKLSLASVGLGDYDKALADLEAYDKRKAEFDSRENRKRWRSTNMPRIRLDSNFIPTVDLTAPKGVGGGGGGGGGSGLKGRTEVDAGQKLIDQMNERIALIGKETEYEKLLAKVNLGSTKFRTEAQLNEALGLAVVIDMNKERAEAEEKAKINVGEMPSAFRVATEEMTVFAEQAARNIQSTLGDGIYGALTGQYNNLSDAFKQMLARMASDIAASQINKLLLGQFGVGGSSQVGGLLGSLAGMMGLGPKFLPAGIGIEGAAGGLLSGGTIKGSALGTFAGLFKGFDEGGFTGIGGKFEPAGIVHKGEYVFDSASVDRLGVGTLERLRRMPGYSDGGLVGRASGALPDNFGMRSGNITVNNYAGVEIEERRMSDGEIILEIRKQISKETPRIMAGQQRDPNSRFSKAQSQTTRVQRNRG